MANYTGNGSANAFTGTDTADTIFGYDGADVLRGGGGNDVIYGHSTASGAIQASVIATGLQRTVGLVSAPGQLDTVYVLENQTGKVIAIQPGGAQSTFLDIPDAQLNTNAGFGLLGMAFHPNYATNGKMYVHMIRPSGEIEVREYTKAAGAATVDPASARTIITMPGDGQTNHNGGSLNFGPDGYLYISVGDGAYGGDPAGNAQNIDSLLGKILRIDINGDAFPGDAQRNYAIPTDNPFVGKAGLDEIWATGLRNPWRMTFDSLTGDIYIGDVGETLREEINFIASGSTGGMNFGWNYREGTLPFSGTALVPLTDPILDYGRDWGNSVTGGYVYRGPSDGLQGHYVFADFGSGRVFSFKVVNGVATDVAERTSQIEGAGLTLSLITSFGLDGRGNLYVTTYLGSVVRLDPGAGAGDAGNRLYGDAGHDSIYGGAAADYIDGGVDNDVVYGGYGNDTVLGGAGNDSLSGEGGNDVLDGGDGADTINGGVGNDFETGGIGNDELNGQDGRDMLIGNAGDDQLNGGGGNDVLYAGDGNDGVNGEDDDDILLGEAGDDWLFGGAGNDHLFGGSGTNNMQGNAGDDVFHAAGLLDIMSTGDGHNYVYRYAAGSSTTYGGTGVDEFIGGSAASNDTFHGDAGADYAFGGNGNDVLNGLSGNDVLLGEAGSDTISGGSGINAQWGGAGNDSFLVNVADGAQTQVVFDFAAGGTDDVARILGSSLTSFAQVQSLIANLGTAQGGNVMYNTGTGAQLYLNLGANQTAIWFQGVSAHALTTSDFAFV